MKPIYIYIILGVLFTGAGFGIGYMVGKKKKSAADDTAEKPAPNTTNPQPLAPAPAGSVVSKTPPTTNKIVGFTEHEKESEI